MIRAVTERESEANIVAIDYDPSAPRVNQENRIKLMLAIANERLEGQNTVS
jgi:predicted nucleotide-binding protein (sugar kinase/HSP70/actin superfamily)